MSRERVIKLRERLNVHVCITLKIAYTVDNQNFETASPIDRKTQVKNINIRPGLRENLMVEVRLGILNEHAQHLFAICKHISLIS